MTRDQAENRSSARAPSVWTARFGSYSDLVARAEHHGPPAASRMTTERWKEAGSFDSSMVSFRSLWVPRIELIRCSAECPVLHSLRHKHQPKKTNSYLRRR